MFDPISKLLLGLLTGFLFGIFLQKGQAAKYQVIMSQFLLKNWTVVKIMATAIIVGSIGVYALVSLGVATLSIKPAAFGGILIGGLLFGVGLAIFGLCPGTSVAACGEGQRDAGFGVVGMLLGAGAYVAFYPTLKNVAQSLGDWGKVTLADVTGISPWVWIAGLVLAGLVAVLMFKAKRSSPPHGLPPVGDRFGAPSH
jgi:uncharacterized protein